MTFQRWWECRCYLISSTHKKSTLFYYKKSPHWFWREKKIQRVHKCGNKQTYYSYTDQRDNKINQTHAFDLRAENGRILPRRLLLYIYIYTYIFAICLMKQIISESLLSLLSCNGLNFFQGWSNHLLTTDIAFLRLYLAEIFVDKLENFRKTCLRLHGFFFLQN
jgi:hypothetical protein